MKISIKSTNIKLSGALREFIREKIGPLEKFVKVVHNGYRSPSGKAKAVLEAFVDIEKDARHKKGVVFKAKCQLKLPKDSIRSEASSDNLKVAINTVKDELQRELKRLKGRAEANYKRKSRASKKEYKITPSARFFRKGRIREEGM